MGCAHGDALFGSSGLSGTEGGSGVRGGHPHSHHCRGRVDSSQAQQGTGRERHHTVDRCLFGSRGGRCHLHAARHLHPSGEVPRHAGRLPEDLHGLGTGRYPGYPVPHTLPQILCLGNARQVSFPRGYRYDTGAGERCQGRRPGQAVAAGRYRGRSLRLHRGHFRMVERELHQPCDRLGRGAGRQGKARVQDQHQCSRTGTGLYHRTEVRPLYHTGFALRVVAHRAGNGTHLRRPGAEHRWCRGDDSRK